MSEGKGTISSNDLMMKLVQAKKVMNKVDKGDYQRGNIDESMLSAPIEESMQVQTPVVNTRPVGTPSVDKIQNSKLPDAIKRAMIENPIPQISLNDTIDMDFVKGAKKLMEREGMISTNKNGSSKSSNPSVNTSDLVATLTPIIENVVRKVMDEKLNQILTAHQTTTINENLVLKVGDSVFKGKITGVNKSK